MQSDGTRVSNEPMRVIIQSSVFSCIRISVERRQDEHLIEVTTHLSGQVSQEPELVAVRLMPHRGCGMQSPLQQNRCYGKLVVVIYVHLCLVTLSCILSKGQ